MVTNLILCGTVFVRFMQLAKVFIIFMQCQPAVLVIAHSPLAKVLGKFAGRSASSVDMAATMVEPARCRMSYIFSITSGIVYGSTNIKTAK